MPWLILFGLGAYLLWKEREKLAGAPASAAAPAQDALVAPPDAPQDAPQDAPPDAQPQDGGAPAPSGGASGGGGYADPGIPVTPTAPVAVPPSIHILPKDLHDPATSPQHASGITAANVAAIKSFTTSLAAPAPAPASGPSITSATVPFAAPAPVIATRLTSTAAAGRKTF